MPGFSILKRALLILVLLFTESTIVEADDFVDGVVAYGRKDYATAFAMIMKAAEDYSPSYDEWLEAARLDNPGMSDNELTSYWWQEYGSKGAPLDRSSRAKAQHWLGGMYQDGKGVEQDYQQALLWFTKAAEAGDVKAQFKLGDMYASGEGVAKDQGQAVRWFRKAAEAGNIAAQFNLGQMYVNGEGVPQDFRSAMYWYTKAAEAGDAVAQNSLGVMYVNGQSVPQDYVQAHKWFNLAAATAIHKEVRDRAVNNRDLAARKMSILQIAEAQKLAREWKPMMDTAPTPQRDTGGSEPVSSGTGFVVSRQGHVLTNHHVIEGCTTIRATTEGRKKELTVVGTDTENDLAVLKLPAPAPNVARFREGRNVRAGDGVIVVGFPLHGLLASEANVTIGTVSALAGLKNDTRFLQLTAPVQPGNSGGPLLDQSGQIMGIVVSKLNALNIAKSTGDIPQNINFAINGAIAKSFLDSQSVEYETGPSSKKVEPAEIGAAAKKFTLLVECYR